MTLGASLEAVIHRHTQAATPLLQALIVQLARAQAHEKVSLLNTVILSGPAYDALYAVPAMPRLQDSALIRREMAVVQQVPMCLLTRDLDTLLDIELANIVAPPMPLLECPADKWRVLLEACTDLRRIAFSHVIRCLCTQPLCPQQLPRAPEAQRALTFAVCMLTERGLSLARDAADPQAGWQPYTDIQDPIARLSSLLALKSAVQRRLLSPTIAQRVLEAWATAWTS